MGIGSNDNKKPKAFKHYQVGGFSIKRFRSGTKNHRTVMEIKNKNR